MYKRSSHHHTKITIDQTHINILYRIQTTQGPQLNEGGGGFFFKYPIPVFKYPIDPPSLLFFRTPRGVYIFCVTFAPTSECQLSSYDSCYTRTKRSCSVHHDG
jgi:hypothetical protein